MTTKHPSRTPSKPMDDRDLFDGLQALSDTAFPKTCGSCGRVYRSAEEFTADSLAPGDRSGLKQAVDDDEQPVVELFRNCQCGSTLLDFFENRRDNSARGQKRRDVFGRVMTSLCERGLTPAEARQELRRLMNGQASVKLEALGLRLKVASPGPD